MAFGQTSTDFMQAMKKADVDVTFDVKGAGKEYKVAWGMDAAWNWDYNIRRGANYIGKSYQNNAPSQLSIARVAFQPTDLVIDNGDGTYELTAAQKEAMKSRCDNIKNLTGVTAINMTADQEAYYPVPQYVNNYYGKVNEWYKLIKASVKYCEELGMTVYSISPYNEPDYTDWKEGTKSQYKQLCQLLREDPYFNGIDICGANTLDCDKALSWYNEIKDYLAEGNTHQLAGSLDNYGKFFTQVKADGKIATADELHNVGEAIVGVNYGMERGIWWGFGARAEGQFCIDSNEGVRLGYGENAATWTSAAVYRNDVTGQVHGYIGTSERQANTSSFAFVSKGQDVYFDGYGPTRMYVYEIPGGTGYQKGQINAERTFDITWGEDVPLGMINGTYRIVHRYTGLVLTANGENAVTIKNYEESGTSQHWHVYPGQTDHDISYWFIDNVNTNTTKVNLNVHDNSLESGANLICWDAGHNDTEQWYLKYAQNGCYYIISKLSNKYLYCTSSSTSGTQVEVRTGPAPTSTAVSAYLWRFQPTDAKPINSKADTRAPQVPTNLAARQRTGSVELSWTAPTDNDPLTYLVLRAEQPALEGSPIEYNTIGRNIEVCTFTDNTAISGKQYLYKVKAVDKSGNRSKDSEVLAASPLDQQGLLCQLQFDGDLTDATPNNLNASLYGTASYSAYTKKSGTKSFLFNGSSYLMLPYSIAQQDEMTIATWVYWNGGNNWQRIFDFGNSKTQYFFLCPNNGSEMRFVMKDEGDEQILSAGSPLGQGAWHHIAVTLRPTGNDKVEASLYIDGTLAVQRTDFTIRPSDIAPSLCYVGRSMFGADPYFNGRIDDLRIYNQALSADEVAALMTDLDAQSKDISEDYKDISTGIDQVKATTPATSDGMVYDLSGRPATPASRGILIQNGKKIYQNK